MSLDHLVEEKHLIDSGRDCRVETDHQCKLKLGVLAAYFSQQLDLMMDSDRSGQLKLDILCCLSLAVYLSQQLDLIELVRLEVDDRYR